VVARGGGGSKVRENTRGNEEFRVRGTGGGSGDTGGTPARAGFSLGGRTNRKGKEG